MRDFFNGLARSKTIAFSVFLAILGATEANVQLIQPYMTSKNFAFLMFGISIIVAVLRGNTTDSLEHKGNDQQNNRVTDPPTTITDPK